MNRFKIFFIFFILFVNMQNLFPDEENFSCFLGEKLTYKVTWFNIYAGDTVISLREVLYNGKKAYEFSGKVTSARWFSKIYYVEDTVITIVDCDTLKPIVISVDYREGKKYKRKAKYVFDYERKKVIVEGDKKTLKESLPETFTEMFSAFYAMRMFDFKKEKKISRVITDGRKLYKVSAVFKGLKTIDSILGETKCIVIQPMQVQMDLLGLSQDPESLSIYLTDDKKRIPLLAEGKIRIGSLYASLNKIEKI